MTQGVDALIKRLEEATAGRRFIDLTIWELVDPAAFRRPAPEFRIDGAPHYTTSIDAALSLVPEGWRVRQIEGDDDGWRVALFCPDNRALGWPYKGKHNQLALALCIAALKARLLELEGKGTGNG